MGIKLSIILMATSALAAPSQFVSSVSIKGHGVSVDGHVGVPLALSNDLTELGSNSPLHPPSNETVISSSTCTTLSTSVVPTSAAASSTSCTTSSTVPIPTSAAASTTAHSTWSTSVIVPPTAAASSTSCTTLSTVIVPPTAAASSTPCTTSTTPLIAPTTIPAPYYNATVSSVIVVPHATLSTSLSTPPYAAPSSNSTVPSMAGDGGKMGFAFTSFALVVGLAIPVLLI